MAEMQEEGAKPKRVDKLAAIIPTRYRVEKRLARGGMGTVYLAKDTVLSRDVAVKVVKIRDVDDIENTGNIVERFRHEAEALARLNHRHIVTVHDYGAAETGYYLVMEYVDGPTLTFMLNKDPEFTTQRGLKVLLQVIRALRYSHKHGIVHRDLKTSNILVSQDLDGEDVAKLIDFGLVKQEDQEGLTEHGLMLGTPHAMAPEQIRGGGDIDQRTDVYAMGVCLYRVVCGRNPFVGSQTEIIAAQMHTPPPRFYEVAPDISVPAGLEDIVLKCLEKKPEDRFEDCSELFRELMAVLAVPESEYVSASLLSGLRTSEHARAVGSGRTKWLAAALVLLIGAAVLTAGAAGVVLGTLTQIEGRSTEAAAPAPPDPVPLSAAATPAPAVAPVVAPEPVATDAEDVEEPATDEEDGEEDAVADAEPSADVEEPEPAPRPRPRPRPAPVAAPVPEPAPAPAPVAAPAPAPVVAVAPDPAPDPQEAQEVEAATLLEDVNCDVNSDRVVCTFRMSTAKVSPAHYPLQGSDPTYPTQYVIQFKGGRNAFGARKLPVGSPLVNNITIGHTSSGLVIKANSKLTDPVGTDFKAAGSTYRLTVRRL